MNKNFNEEKIFTKISLNEEQRKNFNILKDKFKLHPLLAKYIAHKGIKEFDYYLNPTIEKLDDVNKIADIEIGKKLFVDKIKSNPEKILVVGDYDTDGITASSIIYLFVKEYFNVELDIYVPERIEGYGLKKPIIDYAKKNNKDFILTVDNGIAAFEAVDYAKELGMTVVITDHHLIQNGIMPNADAILNSIRPDCNYKDKHISGVGMAFNLIRAIDQEIALKYLTIIAIGTVADVVPLINENRIYVYEGMKTPINSKGLQALLDKLEIKGEITSTDIGFRIAPIINSAGREGFARKAFNLLVSEDDNEIQSLLEEMWDLNIKRKEAQKEIEIDVMKRINVEGFSLTICADIEGYIYNPAIVGIVASKIVERYRRPTVIFSIKEIDIDGKPTKVYSGSARGVSWFDFSIFIEKLQKENILISGGGHKGAAGLAIKIENLKKFEEIFEELAKESYQDEEIEVLEFIELPSGKQDTKNILRQIFNIFKKIEPVGEGNRFPLIAYDPGEVNNIKTMGKDNIKKHFHFRTESGIRVIAFNKCDDEGNIPDLNDKNIIANITENFFTPEDSDQEFQYFELMLQDLFKK